MTASFLPTVPTTVRRASVIDLGIALAAEGEAVDGKYSLDALRAAFTAVEDPANWKRGVEAVAIPASCLDIVKAAVVWFTGGSATTAAVTADRYAILSFFGYYAETGEAE